MAHQAKGEALGKLEQFHLELASWLTEQTVLPVTDIRKQKEVSKGIRDIKDVTRNIYESRLREETTLLDLIEKSYLRMEFFTIIVATLQWGFGDLFVCWTDGRGWQVCY